MRTKFISIITNSTVAIGIVVGVAVATLTGCGQPRTSAGNPNTSDVAQRQALMKDWRSANDIMKGMVENPANFDAAVIQEQAKFIQSTSSQMWSYYGDSSAKGNAQDTIWSDPTAFGEASANFDAAVTALNAAAQTATTPADIEAPLAQMYESCGSCHKQFKR